MGEFSQTFTELHVSVRDTSIFSFPDDNLSKWQGLLTKLAICIDIIKIWFRIVICPSVIFFPDIFAMITLIHKQIIAMAGYYACGAFIYGKDKVFYTDFYRQNFKNLLVLN